MEIPSSCFNNAAYDGVDNFSTDAHLLHALVVLKRDCAQTSGQLPDLEYRLVRAGASSGTPRLGIFDYRGGGRPDYRYRGQVSNTLAGAGTVNAPILSVSANQVVLSAPFLAP